MLYVVGVDGLTTFISVEPYSLRIEGRQGNKGTEDMNVNPEVGTVGGGFTLVFL